MNTTYYTEDGKLLPLDKPLPDVFIMVTEKNEATIVDCTGSEIVFSPLTDELRNIILGVTDMLQDFLDYHANYGLWWYARNIEQEIRLYGIQDAIGIVEGWLDKLATDSTIRRFCTQLLDLMY